MQKHKKNTNKKLIFEIIVAIVIIILGILIFKTIREKQSVKDGKGIVNQIQIEKANITEEKTERMLQLEKLQKENPEIIGYLEIPRTNISYPVLQTTNNDFYMKKNYKKEYSKDGSIFLDKDYNWEIPSSNLLIYGHNNKNGQMF